MFYVSVVPLMTPFRDGELDKAGLTDRRAPRSEPGYRAQVRCRAAPY